MLEELKEAKEVAIDLEHHDQRSYIGLVSLMQISTRDKDWIVDTLKPWRRKLSILNEVFTDPRILKVLHGSHMDMIWLQRDLGLYVVGLFDTYHASRVLGYAGGSLAFLLKKFIDFDAQKQYQTADWRIRPLPHELLDYARSDTHFLLYIYDNMRNELLERSNLMLSDPDQDKLHAVLNRSKEFALQVYQHTVYDPEYGLGAGGWYKMLLRNSAMLTREQFAVFRAVHQWRDQIAREQDDSTNFVLANHQLYTVAKEMPTEQAKLFNLLIPLSQTVRLRADEVLEVVRRAKAEGVNGPELTDRLRQIDIHLHGEGEEPKIATPIASIPAPEVAAQKTSGVASSTYLNPQYHQSDLRAVLSRFWGKSAENGTRSFSTIQPRMVIPLPSISIEDIENMQTVHQPVPPTIEPVTPIKAEPEIFTVRQLSHKRSMDQSAGRDDQPDALATNTDEVSIDGNDLRRRQEEKAQRKAEKKAAKRAKLEANGNGPAMTDEAEVPFDYAKAPSVLHSRSTTDKVKEKQTRKPAFSMAKGLGDVAKGLGRRQRESAGKSMTFSK